MPWLFSGFFNRTNDIKAHRHLAKPQEIGGPVTEFAHPQQRLEALDMSVYRVEVEIRERGVSL